MKQMLTYLFLSLSFLLTTHSIYGQNEAYGQCGDTNLSTSFSNQCYSTSIFPDKISVTNYFVSGLKRFLLCLPDPADVNCQGWGSGRCAVIILGVPEPTIEGNKWCFNGTVEWLCRDCSGNGPVIIDTFIQWGAMPLMPPVIDWCSALEDPLIPATVDQDRNLASSTEACPKE